MKYLILKRDIDIKDTIPDADNKTQYWLFEVNFHEWRPSSFSEDPIWWWFASEQEVIDTLWWTYKIEKEIQNFSDVADIIHFDFLSLIQGHNEINRWSN